MLKEKFSFGLIDSPYDIRDYTLPDCASDKSSLPEEYKINSVPVKNQGIKPTCVAHACSEIVEYYNREQKKKYDEFSTDFIYGYRESGYYKGDGMCLRDALKTLQKYGDVEYKYLSTNSMYETASRLVERDKENLLNKAYPNRISSYFRVYTPDELKFAILNYGPVAISMKWFEGACLSLKGEYVFDPNDTYSGHAVMVIGWTKDYFIVQNSWGDDWGNDGMFYLPIEKAFSQVIKEAYGTTDTIIELKEPSTFVRKISKIVNAVVNFFKNIFYKN